MKAIKFLVVTIFLFTITVNAQITKGYWMMGGGASIGNFKSTTSSSNVESTSIRLFPNLGYFALDKLSVGFSGEYTYIFKSKGEKIYSSNSIAPFIRYYFLKNEKEINIFSEVSYGLARNRHSDFKLDNFKVKAGTVFFLNSCVGLEVALNYSNVKSNADYEYRAIYLDGGLQIHLEKK